MDLETSMDYFFGASLSSGDTWIHLRCTVFSRVCLKILDEDGIGEMTQSSKNLISVWVLSKVETPSVHLHGFYWISLLTYEFLGICWNE